MEKTPLAFMNKETNLKSTTKQLHIRVLKNLLFIIQYIYIYICFNFIASSNTFL